MDCSCQTDKPVNHPDFIQATCCRVKTPKDVAIKPDYYCIFLAEIGNSNNTEKPDLKKEIDYGSRINKLLN